MAVYLLRCLGSGLVKIGTSRSPEKRRREIEVGSAAGLEGIACFSGGQDEEREMHAAFSFLRSRGEWFLWHEFFAELVFAYQAEGYVWPEEAEANYSGLKDAVLKALSSVEVAA